MVWSRIEFIIGLILLKFSIPGAMLRTTLVFLSIVGNLLYFSMRFSVEHVCIDIYLIMPKYDKMMNTSDNIELISINTIR